MPRTKESGIAAEVLNDDAQESGSWHEVTVGLARGYLALEAERDVLREALEPFALPLADRQVHRGYVSARLLVSDIRRARAALERPE